MQNRIFYVLGFVRFRDLSVTGREGNAKATVRVIVLDVLRPTE
jgi:hypothetical protein